MKRLPEITWRELTGNKFNRRLHPAMLTISGYITTMKIKQIGESVSQVYKVTYDREYALEYISRRVCVPLHTLDGASFAEIMAQAWEMATHEHLQLVPVSGNKVLEDA